MPQASPATSSASETEETTAEEHASQPLPQSDHNYSLQESPRKLKRKLNEMVDKMEGVRKKLKVTQQKTRRLKHKVNSLKDVVASLKEQRLISDTGAEMLEKTFSGIPLEVMKRAIKQKANKITRRRYSPLLRSFALTLQFYSTKAYNYVRSHFLLALPHPSTIRCWYQGMKGEPGFTEEAFIALQARVEQRKSEDKQVICSLMIDEMAIKKHVEWDGKRFLGYADIGTGIEDDTTPVAGEALVFMVVSLTENWKVPCGYFLIKGMTGQERANLVKQCIMKLHDIGVRTVSLTCDGPSCHFSMMKELGASLDAKDIVHCFEHPSDPTMKVFVLLDVCHMLKLTRNTLAQIGILKNKDGQKIQWKYFEDLHKLQEKEGLRLGNKFKSAHIEWSKQKMKVNLAAQTLSTSVADAMEYCNNELKLKEFEGCEATIKFIRVFDRLFDTLNSRNPVAKGYKAPMRPSNKSFWEPFLHEASAYIATLTFTDGKLVTESRRKTPFIGFITAIKSVLSLFDTLVQNAKGEDGPMKYMLTYKLSQDHLELFFGAVRSACGCNNNPTVRQFMAAYKRLLMRHEIKGGSGNVVMQDNTTILYTTKNSIDRRNTTTDTLNVSNIKRYDLDMEDAEDDFDATDIPKPVDQISPYKQAAIGYIAGYVVRMVRKHINCPTCTSALVSNATKAIVLTREIHTANQQLINTKDRGGLVRPSQDVVLVCEATEVCFQRLINSNAGKLPQAKGIVQSIVSVVLKDVAFKAAFDTLYEHMLDSTPDNNHIFSLIKCISSSYCKIRLHHLAKTFTEKLTGPKVRKQLTKLVLFKHQ